MRRWPSPKIKTGTASPPTSYDITYGSIKDGEDNLVIIDDSIVRTTLRQTCIIKILNRLNPKRSRHRLLLASSALPRLLWNRHVTHERIYRIQGRHRTIGRDRQGSPRQRSICKIKSAAAPAKSRWSITWKRCSRHSRFKGEISPQDSADADAIWR